MLPPLPFPFASAPAARQKDQASGVAVRANPGVFQYSQLIGSAIRPRSLRAARSAPSSNRRCATPGCRLDPAACSGVLAESSRALTSAPASTSSARTSGLRWLAAATCKGVARCRSLAWTSAPAASSTVMVPGSARYRNARCRGVARLSGPRSWPVRALTSAPAFRHAATVSGVAWVKKRDVFQSLQGGCQAGCADTGQTGRSESAANAHRCLFVIIERPSAPPPQRPHLHLHHPRLPEPPPQHVVGPDLV